MSSSNYNKANELWNSFRKEVKYNHRFFPAHEVLEMLASIIEGCEIMVSPGTIYYRARIIDYDAGRKEHMIAKCYGPDSTEEDGRFYFSKANKFRGLSKEGSYVPSNPDKIMDARSNAKFIRFLYIAESPTTAVFEVRPLLSNAVNVAGIEVKETLKIANIAVDINLDPKTDKTLEQWILSFIQSAFSIPTNNPDDYIPSQIIAEYIRNLGYDGIRYSSSLHRGGYNLTVFDISKCEPVFSTDLRFEDMKISLRPAIGAENTDGRFQWIKDNVPMRMDKESNKLVEAIV